MILGFRRKARQPLHVHVIQQRLHTFQLDASKLWDMLLKKVGQKLGHKTYRPLLLCSMCFVVLYCSMFNPIQSSSGVCKLKQLELQFNLQDRRVHSYSSMFSPIQSSSGVYKLKQLELQFNLQDRRVHSYSSMFSPIQSSSGVYKLKQLELQFNLQDRRVHSVLGSKSCGDEFFYTLKWHIMLIIIMLTSYK